MKTEIDQIKIHDSKANSDTTNFYINLGLKAYLNNSTIYITSTTNSQILSFDKNIKIRVKDEYFDQLHQQKILPLISANEQILHDNIGTEVIIITEKKNMEIKIGILTSGGDSPGMNSAVKSIIRSAIKNNIEVYGIYKGYEGLIQGDIRRLEWDMETSESGQSGSCLLCSRSKKFATREGRKLAAYNLFIRRINSLIVIGGDGSMNGALKLQKEFEELCEELINESKIASTNDSKSKNKYKDQLNPNKNYKTYPLNLVGIPGTIDNDIVGTDLTLGSNSAISRVIEVVEKLKSTMRSNKRVFILECMGRDCGWITLMAGFGSEADFILLPECPVENWEDELLKSVKTSYFSHKSSIFVFLCEGAIDINGNIITIQMVRSLLKAEGLNIRSLIVGHIQRGGITTAKDRLNGTIFGLKSVEYLLQSTTSNNPVMIGIDSGKFVIRELENVIRENDLVRLYYKKKQYDKILISRGTAFRNIYNLFESHRKTMISKFYEDNVLPMNVKESQLHSKFENRNKPSKFDLKKIANSLESNTTKILRIGILNDGSPSPGMNTILNTLIQSGLSRDYEVLCIFDGYDGLAQMQIKNAENYQLYDICSNAGSAIGTTYSKNFDIEQIKTNLEKLQLDYLIVLGGPRNIEIARHIKNVIIIPCCIENDFPGIDLSIGSDTALNSISLAAESLRLTSSSTRRSIFVVEVNGKSSEYLTVLGGLISGAFNILYSGNSSLEGLADLKSKIDKRFTTKDKTPLIIFRNEKAFDMVPTDSLCKLICSGTDINYHYSILGHLERGITTSVYDRISAKLCASYALDMCHSGCSSGIIAVENSLVKFIKITEIIENSTARTKIKAIKWDEYANIISILEL